MAVSAYLVGNDGNFAFTLSGDTTSPTMFKVQSYAASLTRMSSDQTGFGDTGKRKRLGMLDLTGSINAVMGFGTSSNGTNATILSGTQGDGIVTNMPIVTLSLFTNTTTNACSLVSTAIFSQFNFNVNKAGDSTVTANFENAGGTAPVVAWLV